MCKFVQIIASLQIGAKICTCTFLKLKYGNKCRERDLNDILSYDEVISKFAGTPLLRRLLER